MKAAGLAASHGSADRNGAVCCATESFKSAHDETFLPSIGISILLAMRTERFEIERLVADAGSEAASRIQLLGYKSGEDLQREVGNARLAC